MMWARSVIRSSKALHKRGLGNTCVHSENGRFVVTINVARSARSAIGLSLASRRRLRQIAAQVESGKANPIAEPQRIKAGTRLLREWQGRKHIVTAAQTGYEYQGTRYGSLSEIARHITGTRWSGPLFFGLKAAGPKRNGARNGR